MTVIGLKQKYVGGRWVQVSEVSYSRGVIVEWWIDCWPASHVPALWMPSQFVLYR